MKAVSLGSSSGLAVTNPLNLWSVASLSFGGATADWKLVFALRKFEVLV